MDKFKGFIIDRLTRDLPNITLGRLAAYNGGQVYDIGYTCELPYLSNEQNISCVPPGRYDLISRYSNTLKQHVLALQNYELGVTLRGPSQRTYVYMHVANFPSELEGCIAPGLVLHPDKWGVLESEDAMELVFKHFNDGLKQLLIR